MTKDYTDIGTVTAMDLFNRKLAEKVQEFAKKHLPYDEPCARLEFRDKLEEAERESERRHGFVKLDEIKVDITDNELEKYGYEDRFVLDEDQEDYVDKVIEGSRTQVIIGHTLSYKCKNRGHGISVFIPIKEYNEMQKPIKKEK